MSASNKKFDLIIIGAGPAGLATAIEAANAGLSYLVLDKGGIAHSIARFQREMFFFSTPELLEIGDIPFMVPTTRPTSGDCVDYYRTVTDRHHLNTKFFQEVLTVQRRAGGFLVETTAGSSYEARFVVLATGYYDNPNPLDVPGEHLPHVSKFYRDALPYYKQNVLIVGGKNSAVEAALDLFRHGANVTLVHRGDKLSHGVKYWILPDFENRAAAGSIKVYFNSTVKKFEPKKTTIVRNGDEQDIETDFAFVLIGYRPDLPHLRAMGIEIDPDSLAPKHNPETFETNVENLYVAGGMVAGRFNNKVFIENGKLHGRVIIKAILEGK
jgi:thioredoxin reductase (NADPH)